MSKDYFRFRNEGFSRLRGTSMPAPTLTSRVQRRAKGHHESAAPRVEQERGNRSEEYSDNEKQWTTSQLNYSQARSERQPWDWPIVRKQIIAHDRAMSHSWNYWVKHASMSWAYWTKDTYMMLLDLYRIMPFAAFARRCCQSFFCALWRGLKVRGPRLVRSIGLVLGLVCILVCNAVLSVVAFCLASWDRWRPILLPAWMTSFK